MVMSGLEAAAAGTLGISLLPFLGAWDLRNAGGRKYRRTVKKLFYLGIAVATVPLGLLVGLLVKLGALLDPRPLEYQNSLKSYQWRRNYRGRHCSGISVRRTLNAVAS